MKPFRTTIILTGLGALMALVLLAPTADAKLSGGKYAGMIHATDAENSNNDTEISFKVDGKGKKIKGLESEFYYGCWIGGSYTLQYYRFPSVHKGPIKIKRNGTFRAKDVIDEDAGFVVTFKGKVKGSSKATGTIKLETSTFGNGCGRDFTWSVKRA